MTHELFVAKIPATVSVEQLRALFERYGKIVAFKRPRDYETGELRSFAFITMSTPEEGASAIQSLNGYLLDGQPIVVKESDKPFQHGTAGGMGAPRQGGYDQGGYGGQSGYGREQGGYSGQQRPSGGYGGSQGGYSRDQGSYGGQQRSSGTGYNSGGEQGGYSGQQRSSGGYSRDQGSYGAPAQGGYPQRDRAVPEVLPAGPDDLQWEERESVLEQLADEAGTATSVKITVIGRPAEPHIQGNTVVLMMQHMTRSHQFPQGVPQPDLLPMNLAIYIHIRQWERVASRLENDPQEMLVVEGLLALDMDTVNVAVFATSVVTKSMQTSGYGRE